MRFNEHLLANLLFDELSVSGQLMNNVLESPVRVKKYLALIVSSKETLRAKVRSMSDLFQSMVGQAGNMMTWALEETFLSRKAAGGLLLQAFFSCQNPTCDHCFFWNGSKTTVVKYGTSTNRDWKSSLGSHNFLSNTHHKSFERVVFLGGSRV